MLFGCNAEKKEGYADGATQDMTIAVDSTADTTASPKIIKTADMQFRVKDVQQAKESLTSHLKSQGGTVVEFAIQSQIQESNKVGYSLDSLKEIISYRKTGMLVAKVPSDKLDDFTNTVAKMAVFVNSQNMKFDDQSIAYLANKLKAQNRVEAIKQINKSATRKSNNVETSLYVKDDLVDRKVENMSIDDRVKFSTITLSFYQDNTVETYIVANDNLYNYKPGFFKRLGLNLVDGWNYFKEFILAIANLWMLVLFGFVIFFGVRHYARRKKN
ncbi:MAG: DUF4349 domain-containing protein [Flavobacterium sp.]|nr:MAG: DUF4349 domain-containing protein [Flavobacterium sp.]